MTGKYAQNLVVHFSNMKSSIADPDPVLFWSGMEKNLDLGWKSWILVLRTKYQFLGKKYLRLFGVDPDPGSCQPWIQEGKSRFRDKHPRSATLIKSLSLKNKSKSRIWDLEQ